MDVGTAIKHPMVDFMNAVDQLRNEHDGLKANLVLLEKKWMQVETEGNEQEQIQVIQELAQRVEAYLKVLHAHAEWEDNVLFPMISMYFQANAAQVAAIEADHVQAELDLRTFITVAKSLDDNVTAEQVRTVGMKLLHACRLLNNHFVVEEEIIFPLAEEILEDIDYMSL
jgi:hemerythrin-like domain-containing protein